MAQASLLHNLWDLPISVSWKDPAIWRIFYWCDPVTLLGPNYASGILSFWCPGHTFVSERLGSFLSYLRQSALLSLTALATLWLVKDPIHTWAHSPSSLRIQCQLGLEVYVLSQLEWKATQGHLGDFSNCKHKAGKTQFSPLSVPLNTFSNHHLQCSVKPLN